MSFSSEGVLFLVWKLTGASEDNDNQFSLVGLSRSPLVPHLGVNFVLPWFLVTPYWRGCNGIFSSNQKL